MNALLLLLGNATANTAAHLCLKRSAISSRARLFLLWQVAGNLVAFAGTVAYTAFLRHVSLHAAYPLSEGLTAHRRAGRGEPHRVPRTDQPPGLGGDGIDRPWYSALQSLNKGGRRMADQRRFMEELRRAWRDEKAAALTYAAAADKETDPRRRDIFLRMAAEEQRHAERWETRLRELGEAPGEYRETETEAQKRRELVAKDPVTIASTMAAAESSADGGYDVLASLAPTEKDRTAFLDAGRAERAHDRVLKDMASTAGHPRSVLDTILGRERHVRGGGWIGQAIYGINDGLGAAFGVVSGVAGATHVNSNFVLLSGFASMIASALSMGSGAYLATKSEKEVHEAEYEKERREIAEHPEEEQQELSLFYQLKGFTEAEADAMAMRMAQNPEEMLKTLAHEELGLSEQAFANPWQAAVSATIATAVGAAVPVLPYVFVGGATALVISFVISTVAHFGVGAAKVVVTGRSWWKSGLEMMVIGLGEAAITYGIGLLVAPALGHGL